MSCEGDEVGADGVGVLGEIVVEDMGVAVFFKRPRKGGTRFGVFSFVVIGEWGSHEKLTWRYLCNVLTSLVR